MHEVLQASKRACDGVVRLHPLIMRSSAATAAATAAAVAAPPTSTILPKRTVVAVAPR
jgi:hypothetical protein